MMKSIHFKYLTLFFFLLTCLFFYIAVEEDDDAAGFCVLALIIAIVFSILSSIYKKKEGLSAPLVSQSADNIPIIDTMATNNTQVIIPDTCPHCKNPNTKRIRLCEWCGNQII